MKPLGFSNGWAELALREPPPLVPSSLIDSWLATGPPWITWDLPSTVVTVVLPSKFWIMPWVTNTIANDEGQRQQDAQDPAGHVDPEVADRAAPGGG